RLEGYARGLELQSGRASSSDLPSRRLSGSVRAVEVVDEAGGSATEALELGKPCSVGSLLGLEALRLVALRLAGLSRLAGVDDRLQLLELVGQGAVAQLDQRLFDLRHHRVVAVLHALPQMRRDHDRLHRDEIADARLTTAKGELLDVDGDGAVRADRARV